MYKKFLLCSAVFAALSISITSCSDDEGDYDKKQPTNVGTLSSGTSLDKDLPEGYRISSVGSYRFYYDDKGRLESIYDGDDYMYFENGTLCFTYDEDETYKVGLNKDNLIASVSMEYFEQYGKEYEKESGTAIFTYNSNNQLTKISIEAEWEEYEDGEKEKGSFTDEYTLTYSGKKLTKVKDSYVEKDEHTDKGTANYTLNYDEENPNPFFQYTPGILYLFDDEVGVEPFFYAGLLGKASSVLPTSISYVKTEYCEEEGEEEKWDGERNCGPYRYNEYKALSSADNYTYRYTTTESRATVNNLMTAGKVNPFKGLFTRPSQRHHKANK